VTPRNSAAGHRILKPESGLSSREERLFGRAFVEGNIVEGNERVTRDNWDGGVQVDDLPDTGPYRDQIKWNQPFPMPEMTIHPAGKAYELVLEDE